MFSEGERKELGSAEFSMCTKQCTHITASVLNLVMSASPWSLRTRGARCSELMVQDVSWCQLQWQHMLYRVTSLCCGSEHTAGLISAVCIEILDSPGAHSVSLPWQMLTVVLFAVHKEMVERERSEN